MQSMRTWRIRRHVFITWLDEHCKIWHLDFTIIRAMFFVTVEVRALICLHCHHILHLNACQGGKHYGMLSKFNDTRGCLLTCQ